MGLRSLLGLPPKKSKSDTPAPALGDPAVYHGAERKYDQVANHPGFALLSEAQKKALTGAREEAGGLQAHGAFDDAAKRLGDATAVAAGQIVKAQSAKKDFESTRPKISGVLDGAQLLGVSSDYIKALRERLNTIVAGADTDIVAGAVALARLGRDIAGDKTIKEARRARDRVLNDKDRVEAEAVKALKVEKETPEVLKQNRILADALPKIGDNAGKLNFIEAERYIGVCETCIAAINAEAPGIAAAIALRDKVKAERRLMDADVNVARRVYGTTDEATGLIKQFKRVDQGFEGAIIAKDYKIAQTYLKQLESLTARILELIPAMEADENARAARKAELEEVRSDYAKVKKIPAVTAELDRIFKLFDSRVDGYFAAYNAREFDQATALTQQIKDLRVEYLTAAEDAADELQKNTEALNIWNNQCKARFGALDGILPTLPDMTTAVTDAKATYERVNAQLTAKEFSAALASAQQLKGLLDTIDGLKEANAAALLVRNSGWGEYRKIKGLCKQALAVKPLTPEMAVLFKTFLDSHDEFHKLRREGDDGAIGKLPDVTRNAQAVVDGKDANALGRDSAEAAAEKARDAAIADYSKAKALAEKYLPASRKELSVMQGVGYDFNLAFKSGRFMESIDHLKRLPGAIKAINDARPGWELTAAAAKSDYDKDYDKVKKDYDKVVAYELVLPGLESEINGAKTSKADADGEYAKGNMGKAAAHLERLAAIVSGLTARKGDHDTAVADKAWVESKKAGIGGDVTTATTNFALLPETQDIQNRMKFALEVADAAVSGLDFAEARRQWSELERLLGLWTARSADNDNAWTAEAQEVDRRLDDVDTELGLVGDIKGITPELKKLLSDFDAVKSRFWKAYAALDWVLVLSLMDAFERRLKALAAKKSDYDSALLAAQPIADTATRELDDISPEDLKDKPTDEKLKLLDDMRATGAELTPAQRKLQRKLYASLDYDPKFKEVDERRRGELVEALKADDEVTQARGNWAGMDDDAKLAVLVKVMNAECRVFNIPPPAVRLFYEPPGDEGFFSPGSMTLNLNTHPDSGWTDYKEAVNTVVHENMHNYQAVLVRRLEEGIITSEDPEYMQALIFAANDAPGGYVPPSETLDADEADTKPYKTQPVEAHAWDSGDGVAGDLMAAAPPDEDEEY